MNENQFEIVKEFRSVDGVVAIITARMKNGRRSLTFSMKKEFDKNGETAQTPWLQKQHVGSVRELLTKVEDYIQHAEDIDRAAHRGSSMGGVG